MRWIGIQAKFGLRTLLLVVAVFVAFAGFVGAASSPVSAQDPSRSDNLDTRSKVVYNVDTDNRRVDVAVSLAVVADLAPRQTSTSQIKYFFDNYTLVVPNEAENLEVFDEVGSLSFVRESSDDDSPFDLVTVQFRRPIFYRETAEIDIRYQIPSGELRSDNPIRINRAYVAFDVWDPTFAEAAAFEVVLPTGFGDSSGAGELLHREERDGKVVFRSTANTDLADDWWSFVSIANDDAYQMTEFANDVLAAEIYYWPNDQAWADYIVAELQGGVADLVGLVGLPWPQDATLAIVETHAPYIHGYGGWYRPSDNRIEVGDRFDRQLLYHELGHVWFNQSLFRDRWINEGLTERFAHAAYHSGRQEPTPEPVSAQASEALPLGTWEREGNDAAVEQWGYAASAQVMWNMTEEIGLEGLAEVVAEAAAGRAPYKAGAPVAHPSTRFRDWRYLLDLLDDAGAKGAEATFRSFVVTSEQAEQLADRAESRQRFGDLAAAGGTWAPPYVVRQAMAEWEFPVADAGIEAAHQVLELRQSVEEKVEPWGLRLSARYERAYEEVGLADSGADSEAFRGFGELESRLETLEVSAEALVETHEAVAADHGWINRIGLIGFNADAKLASAEQQFENDNLDGLELTLDAVHQGIDGSATAGANRILAMLAVFATGGVAGLQIDWHRRRT